MTIRIFCGCSANNEDLEAQAVLDYTLRKHASQPIDLVWMKLSRDKRSFWHSNPETDEGWNTKSWATPFSAFRWAVPAFCKFEGRAVYLDVDMIAMADIAELWTQDIPDGAAMLAKGDGIRFCTTLFDCAKSKNLMPPLDELRSTAGLYRSVRNRLSNDRRSVARFQGNWNCLDGESYANLHNPDIKIIHYTSVPTQVHLKHAKPRLAREGADHWYVKAAQKHPRDDLQALFDELLVEATANGYGIERYRSAETFGDYARGLVRNQRTDSSGKAA